MHGRSHNPLVHHSGGHTHAADAKRDATWKLLEQAVQMRSPITVRIGETGQTKQYSGTCLRLEPPAISVEIRLTELPAEMIGVTAFAHLTVENSGKRSYHQVMSHISNIRHKTSSCELSLNILNEVTPAQRRNFFRVPAVHGTIQALRVWMLDGKNVLAGEPITPNKVLAAKQNTSWALDNISAGGLCIRARLKGDDPVFDAQAGDRLLCYLALRPIKDMNFSTFWLDCAVITRKCNLEKTHISLGLRFRAWTVPNTDGRENIWRAVDSSESIAPLVKWVTLQSAQLTKSAHSAR
jgi:hypothetical protein